MSAAFDFQALAARAEQDNPDAPLLALVEACQDARRAIDRVRRKRGPEYAAACQAWVTAEDRLALCRPKTAEGAAAKAAYACRGIRRGSLHSGPAHLRNEALHDALLFLRLPKPRRRSAKA